MIDLTPLEDLGKIDTPIYYDENFCTVSPTGSNWDALALKISSLYPGNVWPGSDGVTIARGRKAFYIGSHDRGVAIMQARGVAENLGLPIYGYSIGNIARRLLEWTAHREQAGSHYSELRHGDNWGYLHAVPGVYEDARDWDVKSCYYQMFCRLPSLRATHYNERIGWGIMRPDEKSRKRDLQAAIESHKLLRNNLVGCMTGSRDRAVKVAINGKWERRKLGGGAFPTAGYLIVRSGFELCQQAAYETNAVHAATDGVIEASGVRPKAWERVGLETRLKNEGVADIRCWGAYRIGGKQTEFYTDRIRHALEMDAPTVPEVLYSSMWLG